MADMIFTPRRLHPGDIVRTENRKKFYRVYSVDKDFVKLENDDEQNQRYFSSVYPIKLQDTKSMCSLGASMEREWYNDLKRSLRKYTFYQSHYQLVLREIEMGYFRVQVLDRENYASNKNEPKEVFYYFHEVQQFFFRRTGLELDIRIPENLEYEIETVHFWDDNGVSVVI